MTIREDGIYDHWQPNQTKPELSKSKLKEEQQRAFKLDQQTINPSYVEQDIGLSWRIEEMKGGDLSHSG